MTVKELIEKLSDYPQNAIVCAGHTKITRHADEVLKVLLATQKGTDKPAVFLDLDDAITTGEFELS